MSTDSLAASVAALLRQAPKDWADSPDSPDALAALTAAGFVERRLIFTVRLPGEEQTRRVTIEATGELGFAEAMEAVIQDYWASWGERWRKLRQEIGVSIKPIVALERDCWRTTEDGRAAQADLATGSQTPIDFALKRGFFDGKPRALPGGRVAQRLPVAGHGRLVNVENATSGPLAVAVGNWADGAKAFAEAFAKAFAERDVESRAFRRRHWPGADKWHNWGVGVDDDNNWHLFHFHREGKSQWVRHNHAYLNITPGRLAQTAKLLADGGELGIDASISAVKPWVSRLRMAIVKAVHGEGIFPQGNPIPFDYERATYRPVIRFGRVKRNESGSLIFKPS